jgi:TPR repeat protein
MRVLELIAPTLLVVTGAGFSANPPTPELCTQLIGVIDNGTALAINLKAPASKEIEPSQAEAACRLALGADPGNPTFMFQLARALALGGKQLDAIKYYLDAADRGHAGAMNDLGGVFEYGLGVRKNLTTALLWYERAAELGHAGAMIHLGQLNEKGLDIPRDFAKAMHWYEQAADLGNAEAMNNLANMLRQGPGDIPNVPAAADWYLKAAQLGLPSAMNSLGELSEGG